MRLRNLVLVLMAALIPLASCGDDDGPSSTRAPGEMNTPVTPVEMRGFYLTVDASNTVICEPENIEMSLDAQDDFPDSDNVALVSKSENLPDFVYFGIQTTTGMKKTVIAHYVIGDERGSVPGVLYLVSKIDSDISEEEIYAGSWTGNASRPEGNPLITCPYVLVPREAVGEDGCGGGTREMAEGLRKYLASDMDPTELGTCYSPITADGKSMPEDISFGNY